MSTAPFWDHDGLEYSLSPPAPPLGQAAVGPGDYFATVRLFVTAALTDSAVLTEAEYSSLPLLSLQQQRYSLS